MKTKLVGGGLAVALAASLAALGGGVANAGVSNEPCDPNAPGSCDKFDPNDPFANPSARCKKDAAGKVIEPAKTITASGNTFCGKKYAGKTGETWTFNNPDIALHNVATDDFEKNPAKFKTEDVDMGKSTTFKMPKKAGKYTIICTFHPGSMTAKLTLKK